ncbi:uncharacterized protein LOC128205181 [Mya arenaria]|uniref:uncharacterized protein LOC128205181 n=1 Tax=Mya arenaria TaxID=6604 RepID=UPI0022E97117|nr:uncharacterized protein LOC128205181 [Mya arenaria]
MSRMRSAASVRSSATGASVKSTRTNRTSGSSKPASAVIEFTCGACAREKNNIEATNYCQDCAENLCMDCVKQHLKFPTMNEHKILGKEARRSGDEGPSARKSILECPAHPGKPVDMYCANHDEVRCGACIAVNHRTCMNVVMVQQVAKGVAKTDEFKEVRDGMKQVKKELTALKKKNEKGLATVDKQKTAIMKKIKASRKKLDQILDQLEKNTIAELEKACVRGATQLKDDIEVYDEILESFETVTELFTAVKNDPEVESGVYVGMKRCKEKIKEGNRLVEFKKVTTLNEPIKFIPDSRLAGWLKSLTLLGTFESENKAYIGEFLKTVNIQMLSDMRDSDIFGCDFFKDGSLVLSDWDNKNVKLLDENFDIDDYITVDGNPNDVCVLNPDDIAVTMPIQKTIQFIQVKPKMALKHTIKTDDSCRGLASHNGRLFVVCGGFKGEKEGKVVVFSLTGDHIRTIERNNSGQRIFACPIAVCVSSDGKLIHVTDGQRGVVTLTQENDVVSVVSDRETKWPCGICMDKHDNALICNGQSNTVIQVSGINKIATVIQKGDKIKKPHSICCDPATMKMVLTVSKSRVIFVYQLKSPTTKEIADGTTNVVIAKEYDKKVSQNPNKTDDVSETIPQSNGEAVIIPETSEIASQQTDTVLKTTSESNSTVPPKRLEKQTTLPKARNSISGTSSDLETIKERTITRRTETRTGSRSGSRSRDRSASQESTMKGRNSNIARDGAGSRLSSVRTAKTEKPVGLNRRDSLTPRTSRN